jgi:hypothetical protein
MDYARISIPRRGSSWPTISEFAILVDAPVFRKSFEIVAEVANRPLAGLGLEELHVALFHEHRRFLHLDQEPGPRELERIYHILDRMRELQAERKLNPPPSPP